MDRDCKVQHCKMSFMWTAASDVMPVQVGALGCYVTAPQNMTDSGQGPEYMLIESCDCVLYTNSHALPLPLKDTWTKQRVKEQCFTTRRKFIILHHACHCSMLILPYSVVTDCFVTDSVGTEKCSY